MKYDIEKYKGKLKELVSEKRYNHCLMVADESKKLAHIYNYDEEKAYVAGLVHDIAKDITIEESSRIINKYNLNKEFLNDKYIKILHAEVGFGLVKELFNLDDDICNAVRYHTIGNINMDTLAKIVFIADKTARDNLPETISEVKELSYKNLDKALELFLIDEKKYLNSKNVSLHEDTINLLKKLQKK